jgi:hypothetical protein
VSLDLASETTAELVIPYFDNVPYISIGAPSPPFTISIYTWALLNATEPAEVSANYTLSYWVTESEVVIPRPQSGKAKPKGFKVSGIANTVGDMADKVSEFTGSGIAKMVGHAAHGVGKLAELFGFLKPPIPGVSQLILRRTHDDGAVVDGVADVHELTLHHSAMRSIDPEPVIGLQEDQLTMAYLTSRDGYLTSIPWNRDQATDTVLFLTGVSPAFIRYVDYAKATPTPLAMATMPFALWRGSLTYTFTLVASKYHSGSVRIFWTPDASVASPYNTVHSVVFNCNAGNTIQFTVPWGQPVPWLNVKVGEVGNVTPTTCVNGRIVMVVERPLLCNYDSALAYFIVTVRAGPDYEVARPSSDTVTTVRFTEPSDSPWREFDTENISVESYSELGAGVMPINQSSDVVVAPFIDADGSKLVAEEMHGELVRSYRALAKRVTHWFTTSTINYTGVKQLRLRRFPLMPYADAVANYAYGFTYASYISQLFALYSGSTNYTIYHTHLTPSQITKTWGYTSWQVYDGTTLLESFGQYTQSQYGFINGGAIVPRIYDEQSWCARAADQARTRTVRVGELNSPYYPDSAVAFNCIWPVNESERTQIDIYASAGDDFNAYGFIGVPIVWFRTNRFSPPS